MAISHGCVDNRYLAVLVYFVSVEIGIGSIEEAFGIGLFLKLKVTLVQLLHASIIYRIDRPTWHFETLDELPCRMAGANLHKLCQHFSTDQKLYH
jgi:hypothetical protein